MNTEQTDILKWFDSLDAPKTLSANEREATCTIGFNRNGSNGIVGDQIETKASSVAEALEDARIQYEFLTADVLSRSRDYNAL